MVTKTKTKAQPKLSAASQKIVEQAGSLERDQFVEAVTKRLLKLEQDLKAAKAGK